MKKELILKNNIRKAMQRERLVAGGAGCDEWGIENYDQLD